MRRKEVEEKIRVDIDIEKVKESLEIINNYAEDMKKNHQYMSNKEQNALQDLNLYINDSTPNQKIRDKIKELEAMAISQDIYYQDVLKLFEELLGE